MRFRTAIPGLQESQHTSHHDSLPASPIPAREPSPAPSPTGQNDLTGNGKASCACGGGCPRCRTAGADRMVQAKLKTSTPGDHFEQEADRAAQMTGSGVAAAANSSGAPAANTEQNNIGEIAATGMRSGGKPLDASTRETMEAKFRSNFSQVRVHTDDHATKAAGDLNAHAYTVGQDIVFGSAKYRPQSEEGKRLLAHELAHVTQQTSGLVPPTVQREDDKTPLSPEELNKWPTELPLAQRAAGQELKATLYGTATAPTLSNTGLGVGALTDKQKKFAAQIGANRQTIDTSKLSLSHYKATIGKDKIDHYGYFYAGTTPVAPTTIKSMGKEPTERSDQVKKAVWEELSHEGGTSSINAYDSQVFTWGRGFGAASGPLGDVMSNLFKDQDAKNAFLAYGITYEGGWKIVNTQTGGVETGSNALNLLQATPELLGVFIKMGEQTDADPAKNIAQKVSDAQWDIINKPKRAGDVPAWAYQWKDQWIQLVAHITHWWPATGWSESYKDKNTIKEIMMAWGEKACGKKEASGAMIVSNTDTIRNFQTWGKGVAWDELKAVYSEPMPFVKSMLANPANEQFKDKLFILAPGDRGYYVYPEKPKLVKLDRTEDPQSGSSLDYDYFFILNGLNMSDMLFRLQALGKEGLKKKQEAYQGGLGGRVTVAMKVAEMLLRKAVPAEEKKAIEDDPNFKELTDEQKTTIRSKLGL